MTTITTGPSPSTSTFTFPPHYSFPPFYTLQPNKDTQRSQLSSWSSLVQSYCRHHRLFTLSLTDALSTPLFSNSTLNRHLNAHDARVIVDDMVAKRRAEWISGPSSTGATATVGWRGAAQAEGASEETGGKFYVFWRRPEEWAEVIEAWVDGTGQRGVVLTVYELLEGDATRKEEFHGMETDLMVRSLQVLVKRGKAQVFGSEDSLGVKIF